MSWTPKGTTSPIKIQHLSCVFQHAGTRPVVLSCVVVFHLNKTEPSLHLYFLWKLMQQSRHPCVRLRFFHKRKKTLYNIMSVFFSFSFISWHNSKPMTNTERLACGHEYRLVYYKFVSRLQTKSFPTRQSIVPLSHCILRILFKRLINCDPRIRPAL